MMSEFGPVSPPTMPTVEELRSGYSSADHLEAVWGDEKLRLNATSSVTSSQRSFTARRKALLRAIAIRRLRR